MNIKESLYFAPYITALATGQTVQCRDLEEGAAWSDIDPEITLWDVNLQYRVKTAPVLKPYSTKEDILALMGKDVIVKSSKSLIVRRVDSIIKTPLGMWEILVSRDTARYSPEMFLKKYQYIAGGPCGVYVDEVPPPPKKELEPEDDDLDDDEEDELPDEGFEKDEDIGDGPDDPEEEGDSDES